MGSPNEVNVVLKTERLVMNGASDDEEGKTTTTVKFDDVFRIGDAEFFPVKGYLLECVAFIIENEYKHLSLHFDGVRVDLDTMKKIVEDKNSMLGPDRYNVMWFMLGAFLQQHNLAFSPFSAISGL